MAGDNRTSVGVLNGGLAAYRAAITVADGTTKPATNAGGGVWQANPGGFVTCSVFVTSTGGPTACTLRTYRRCGGTAGVAASADIVTLGGTPNFDAGFDVTANGDDIGVLVETLSGGSSPTVTIQLAWR